MNVGVWNILDLIEDYGDEFVGALISDFSTVIERDGQKKPLNPDIEVFLKKNAVQFAKEKKSITYIVGDKDDGSLLGYFTLTHKAIEIPADGLSKSTVRTIEKYSRINPGSNSYTISAFLIAQFGKNYAVDGGKRITGNELMALCAKELSEIRYRIGGSFEYLDCEADASLIRFYQDQQNFRLFGERISENDGKRYLQYMKFLKS